MWTSCLPLFLFNFLTYEYLEMLQEHLVSQHLVGDEKSSEEQNCSSFSLSWLNSKHTTHCRFLLMTLFLAEVVTKQKKSQEM